MRTRCSCEAPVPPTRHSAASLSWHWECPNKLTAVTAFLLDRRSATRNRCDSREPGRVDKPRWQMGLPSPAVGLDSLRAPQQHATGLSFCDGCVARAEQQLQLHLHNGRGQRRPSATPHSSSPAAHNIAKLPKAHARQPTQTGPPADLRGTGASSPLSSARCRTDRASASIALVLPRAARPAAAFRSASSARKASGLRP